MRKFLEATVLSLVLVSFLYSEVPPLPKLTKAQWQKLEKGEIILTSGIKRINGVDKALVGAYLIFSQPITTVWKLMLHPEKEATFLPDLNSSKLLWRKGNKVEVEFTVKIMFVKVVYRVIHTYYPEKYYFNWTLDPNYDNDLKYFYGEWQLYPLPNGKTLAKYMAIVHASPLVPGFIERKLAKSNIPKNMKAFQKWINSNGKYHK